MMAGEFSTTTEAIPDQLAVELNELNEYFVANYNVHSLQTNGTDVLNYPK